MQRFVTQTLCLNIHVDLFIEDLIGGLHLLIIVFHHQPTEVGFKYLVMNCRVFRHLFCVNLSPSIPLLITPLGGNEIRVAATWR